MRSNIDRTAALSGAPGVGVAAFELNVGTRSRKAGFYLGPASHAAAAVVAK